MNQISLPKTIKVDELRLAEVNHNPFTRHPGHALCYFKLKTPFYNLPIEIQQFIKDNGGGSISINGVSDLTMFEKEFIDLCMMMNSYIDEESEHTGRS